MVLEIFNNRTKIYELTEIEYEKLIGITTINIPYFSHPGGHGAAKHKTHSVCYLDKKNISIPTGLVPRIYQTFTGVKHVDRRIRPPKIIDYQLNLPEPAKSGMDYSFQDDAAELMHKNGRGILVFATGGGKTITMAKTIALNGVTAIVMVPRLILLNQTYNVFCSVFGKENVGKLGDGKKDWEKNIIVATQATLWKIFKEDKELFYQIQNHFKSFYVDECHHISIDKQKVKENDVWITKENAGNSWFKIAGQFDCYYKFGVSGTVGVDSKNSQFVLESVTGRILMNLSPSDLIERGILSPLKVKMFKMECELYNNWRAKRNNPGAYEDGILGNDKRNAFLAQLAIDECKKGNKVLINVDLTDSHGLKFHEMIPNSIYLHGNHTTKQREKGIEEFLEGDKVLIGTIFGEGFDLPSLDVIIIAGGGKSNTSVMQNIGRVLRVSEGKEYGLVYDIFDEDGKDEEGKWGILHRHSMSRRKVYRSERAYKFELVDLCTKSI